MRTTVNLDDDVYELASVYVSVRGITLGSALGELVRTANNPLSPVGPFARATLFVIPGGNLRLLTLHLSEGVEMTRTIEVESMIAEGCVR